MNAAAQRKLAERVVSQGTAAMQPQDWEPWKAMAIAFAAGAATMGAAVALMAGLLRAFGTI
jgi:hypothetical protein